MIESTPTIPKSLDPFKIINMKDKNRICELEELEFN